MVCFDFNIRIVGQNTLPSHNSFGFAHMFLSEQELSIQVTDIDSIQIDLKQGRNINPDKITVKVL